MPFAAPSEELVQSQNGFTAPDDDIQQPTPQFQIQNPQTRFTVRPSQSDLRAQQVAARNVQPTTTLGELPAALFTPSDETTARAAAQVATRTPEPVDVNGADAQFINPTSKEDIGTLAGISPDSRAAKVIASGVSAPGQLANSFTTPEGALMFASPAAGAAFVAQMATSVPQKLGAAAGAYSAGDKDTGDSNLVDGLVTAGLLTLPALHAFKKGKSLDDILGAEKANDLRQQVSQPQPKPPNENQPDNITPPETPTVVAAPPAAPDATSPIEEAAPPADNAGNAAADTAAPAEKPVLEPGLRVGDTVYTGQKSHQQIFQKIYPELGADALDAFGDDASHVFVDQNGKVYNREDAAKAIGRTGALMSEDLPKQTPAPSSESVGQQIGAKFDGNIDFGNGKPAKQFTFNGDKSDPHYGATFQVPADATLEQIKSKAKQVQDSFSTTAKYTLENKDEKFNILSPSGRVGETFDNAADANKALADYNPENLAPPPSPQAEGPTASLQPAKSVLQDSGSDVPLPEGTPTPAPASAEGVPTGLKFDTLDKERAARGLEPLTRRLPVADQETMNKAMETIDKNPDHAANLVKELNIKPRTISDVDRATLLLRRIDLRKQYSDAADDLTKANESGDDAAAAEANVRVADASDKLQELEEASGKSGSEQGAGLRALRLMANEDYSLAGLEQRARASKGGQPLTDVERAELVKTAADYKKANDELQKHLDETKQRNSELEVKSALDRIALEAKNKTRTATGGASKGLLSTLEQRANAARERIKNRPVQLNTGLDPTQLLASLRDEIEIGAYHIARIGTDVAKWTKKQLDDWTIAVKKELGDKITPNLPLILEQAKNIVADASKPPTHEEQIAAQSAKIKEKFASGKKDEIASQVQKLARLFVERGITGRDALIDAVHNVLKESDPEITRRDTMDAISGYGDFKQLSKDEISQTLRDLKGQLQQLGKLEDIQSKKPPLKTGVERRTPSDEERKLIQQVNEAKRQFGVETTDSATQLKSALDSRKTALRNQITDLEKQIESKEKFVKSKTPAPSDAELIELKKQRDELKSRFDEIFNPKLTDAQKYERALQSEKKALEKSISEKQNKLNSGDFAAKPKEVNRPADPTLEPLKQQRDALNKKISEARKKPAAKKYAEAQQRALDAINKQIADKEAAIKSGDVASKTVSKINRPLSPGLEQAKQRLEQLNKQIDEIRNPKKSPESIALKALKARLEKSIKEMEDKIASGDFSKTAKKPAVLDQRAQELTAQKERVAKKFKQKQKEFENESLSKAPKTANFISNLRRFAVLSGAQVIGKLASYSATKIPTIGATEAIGNVLSKLPKLSQIAKVAPSEGSSSLANVARATAKGLTKGFEDAYKTAKTGQSDLKAAFSDRPEVARSWLNFFQTVHEVIKSPLRRAAFELSLAKRMESAARNGADINDPMTQLALSKDAYLDSDRALLLENNRLANGIRVLLKNLETPDKKTGRIPIGGKTLSTIGRVELPILTVPLNYVKQTLDAAFGLAIGSGKAALAFRRGIDNLDPKEADEILRHLKYGTIGGAALLYGFYDGYKNAGNQQNATLGGFYQPGEKRKDNQAGINGIRVGGHNVAGLFLHNPVLAVAQLGHTMGAILGSKINKKSDQKHSAPVAVASSLMGLLNESPYGTTTDFTTKLADSRSAEYALGEHIKGLIVPTGVQELAKASDLDAKNNVIKRDPKTALQHIETGIPFLRQTVKKK